MKKRIKQRINEWICKHFGHKTFEETMKDVQTHNAYKEEQWIEKACNWLKEQKEMIGISFQEDFIERFKTAMKK